MVRPRLTESLTWKEIADKVMQDCNLKETHHQFKKWFLSKEVLGGCFFNSLTYGRAYHIQKLINTQDRDHFIVVSGLEGFGKSTFAIQLACVLSPRFKLQNICYRPIDFIRGIRTAEKGDVFVLDEGNLFLFSRESMGDDNKTMVKLFALMRQKNLCVIICVPNFFTLDSYVRDHRTQTLLHLHRKGNFTCYVGKAIRIVSKQGFKFKQVAGVKVAYGTFFNGYFNKGFPVLNDISRESYLKHKAENFEEFLNELEQNMADREGRSKFVSISQAKRIIPLDKQTYLRMLNEGKIKGKKVGNKWFIERESISTISQK